MTGWFNYDDLAALVAAGFFLGASVGTTGAVVFSWVSRSLVSLFLVVLVVVTLFIIKQITRRKALLEELKRFYNRPRY